jgi:hypothetical protein
MRQVASKDPYELAHAADGFIATNSEVRSTILSVGLPILLSDGCRYLRGATVLVPSPSTGNLTLTPENIDRWCHDGWLDMRPSNWAQWIERCRRIIEHCSVSNDDTSSRAEFTAEYWEHFESINEGKLAAYILYAEEGGGRTKR